jgi:hypothetical protein
MKFRGLIVALIVLALLGGALYFAGKRKTKSEVAEAGKSAEKLFSVPADDIQQMSLQPASGDKVTLDRDGDKWKISEPAGVNADEYATSTLATTLGSLSVDQVISDSPGALKDYGLDPPQETIRFRTKAGAEHTLLIGESTPTGGGVYAKADNQARVVTVSDRFDGWAKEVAARLDAEGFRVEVDHSSDKLGAKIRNAQLAKIPFALVIGEKEVEAKGVAPRRHGADDLKAMSLDAFVALMKKEATPPY